MVRLVRFNREPDFSDLFNRFFDNDLGNTKYVPATNINENDESFELSMLVPGFKKDQINITFEDQVLTISAQAEESKENEEYGSRKEYRFESFSRSFRLPKNINVDKINAEQADGVLRIAIPKMQESEKPKKLIAIR